MVVAIISEPQLFKTASEGLRTSSAVIKQITLTSLTKSEQRRGNSEPDLRSPGSEQEKKIGIAQRADKTKDSFSPL